MLQSPSHFICRFQSCQCGANAETAEQDGRAINRFDVLAKNELFSFKLHDMSDSQSNFYVTGGTLRHDAPSYVERQADRDLLEGLQKGEFCYVLTSRQMGKSSLMVRTATKLRDQGTQVVVLDLTAVGQNLTPEQWYDGLLVRLARQCQLEEVLEQFWTSHFQIGPCQRFFDAIWEVLLPRILAKRRDGETARRRDGETSGADEKVVIFVDEIDTVRSLPFSTDEFFAAIRECYNRRTEEEHSNRLTFCLLGVATPSDLIRDTRLTPFNIGRRIELNDFTTAEAAPLARGLQGGSGGVSERESVGASERGSVGGAGHERTENAARCTLHASRLLDRILYWTNGHPYLTQRLCEAVAKSGAASRRQADRVCAELFFTLRARERDDNLLFVRERLLRSEVDRVSLLNLYEQVLTGRLVADDETNPLVSALLLAGVVRSLEGRLLERNRIYERVFDRLWIIQHMPGAEVRRQRAAFRRGVLRATAIAAVIIAAMTVVILIAVNQAAKARIVLSGSGQACQRLSRPALRQPQRLAGGPPLLCKRGGLARRSDRVSGVN